MNRSMIFSLVTALASGPAVAEVTAVPDGCEAIATVEYGNCVAETFLDCGDEKQTFSYSQDTHLGTSVFTQDMAFKHYTDAIAPEESQTVVPNDANVFSFKEFVDTGKSTSEREFTFPNAKPAFTALVKKLFLLNGRSEKIGDTEFALGRIQADIESLDDAIDGVAILRRGIKIYVSQELGIILEGSFSQTVIGRQSAQFEHEPRDIHFLGDSHFLTTRSRFGCGDD